MANYLSPTVIQQPIPVADMTLLERLVLSLIFDAEPDGEAVYFHTSRSERRHRAFHRRTSCGVRCIRAKIPPSLWPSFLSAAAPPKRT